MTSDEFYYLGQNYGELETPNKPVNSLTRNRKLHIHIKASILAASFGAFKLKENKGIPR